MPDSVLIVDDDDGVCVLLKKWVTDAGYEVSVAANGAQAIKAFTLRPFNLLLTDIIMPDREGIETLLEVRQRWPKSKIVAMSGGGRVDAEQFLSLAGHLGADATLRKPFKREALLELLAATLSQPAYRSADPTGEPYDDSAEAPPFARLSVRGQH